jgi:hypothetical protein
MASKSAGASHSTNAAGPLSANIFFAFNTSEPYQDKAHIFDRDGRVVHGRRFGLSLGDGLSLARVMLTPEAMLGGRRITSPPVSAPWVCSAGAGSGRRAAWLAESLSSITDLHADRPMRPGFSFLHGPDCGERKTDTMIDTKADTGLTIITICKYDNYQQVSLPDVTDTSTPSDTAAIQSRRAAGSD